MVFCQPKRKVEWMNVLLQVFNRLFADDEETRRFRNGEDTRYLPLTDRKQRLRTVVPKRGERLLYCDHVDGDGEGLFGLACEYDLEGNLFEPLE